MGTSYFPGQVVVVFKCFIRYLSRGDLNRSICTGDCDRARPISSEETLSSAAVTELTRKDKYTILFWCFFHLSQHYIRGGEAPAEGEEQDGDEETSYCFLGLGRV